MDRDKFLEADEAKEFGIIDEVFDKRPEQGEDGGTGAGGCDSLLGSLFNRFGVTTGIRAGRLTDTEIGNSSPPNPSILPERNRFRA